MSHISDQIIVKENGILDNDKADMSWLSFTWIFYERILVLFSFEMEIAAIHISKLKENVK